MPSESIVFSVFLIFTGAALLATAALFARQAMPVAYIVLGVAVGPSGLRWISDAALIEGMAHIGIIFLLFLLGLNLHPQKLLLLFRQTTIVTLASSLVFAAGGFLVAFAFGLRGADAALVGVATAFSSTIVALKLVPTTVLHHRHMGELMISVLLLQDLLAILALLVLHGLAQGLPGAQEVLVLALSLPALVAVALMAQRYLITYLLGRFDRIQEYVFLLALGWCLGVAQAAQSIGLSYEIGAFIAGVAMATHPISRFIAENLKPLRDFFLIMFFFALGAGFDVLAVTQVFVAASLLAALVLAAKPLVFRFLLVGLSEKRDLAWETGFRLGQMSEFSLLIVFVGVEAGLMGPSAAQLVQLATILTFIGSSYLIVLRYPTPIAVSDRLRRD